jgi:hypothetical protein
MPYYQGDYYGQGGYYQGDPGIFGFLGRAAKAALGFIPGVGPALSTIVGVTGEVIRKPGVMQRVGRVAGGVVARHPVLTAAGAAGALGALGRMTAPGQMLGAAAAGGCPKGFHPCKSRHGCKKGPCVRNRHMRVTNPRALRRGLRRATGFAKLAMRTIHLVHPRKKARFGGFRRKRK